MKKGFTLIELLAVLILISVIMVIAVPQVLNVVQKTKENTYKLNLDLMKKATETYVESGKKEMVGTSATITLDELISNGFIGVIKDPADKTSECEGYVSVEIIDNDLEYTPCLRCGENFITEDFNEELIAENPQEEEPQAEAFTNANIHQTSVPSGYIGIYTIEDLNNMRNNLSGNYILMNNLDFNSDSSYANSANKSIYTTGTGWTPVATIQGFVGNFNGNNYVIKNLYINQPEGIYVSLFGVTDSGNVLIENLGLENVNIVGGMAVGGLFGVNSGTLTIRNVYISGSITANADYVSSLIGFSMGTLTVDKCYNLATITGNDYVFGLVVTMALPTISNSFSAGDVYLTGSSSNYGLLTTVESINSYYSDDAIASGSGTPFESGKEIPEVILKSQGFINHVLGFDIDNVWYSNGTSYPVLGGTVGEKVQISNNIASIDDLYYINYDLDNDYILTKDLDFNNDNDYQEICLKDYFTENLGWKPIGDFSDYSLFTGTFNGNGHVIRNLYINRPTEEAVALFGYLYEDAVVENLGLESVNITGDMGVGALSGAIGGSVIKNCYSSGNVTAISAYAGGLIGTNQAGGIENSYSIANVEGNTHVGGLIGANGYMALDGSYVSNGFSTGNITITESSGYYGKFIGQNFGTVTNCYYSNSSTVTGTGTQTVVGTGTTITNLQSLNQTGLTSWDTTNIWQINSGAYPTLR